MKHINHIIALALAVMMLAVPAMAAGTSSPSQDGSPSVEQNGTPSVEQEASPSVEQNGSDKVDNDEIIINTVMDKDSNAKVAEALEAAQKQLADTADLTTIAPALADVLKELNIESADKLAVRDLFNLAVTGKTEEQFKADKKLTVTFNIDLEADQNLIVMVQNGEQWDVIPAVDVNYEDGKATVTFTELGIVAFVVG